MKVIDATYPFGFMRALNGKKDFTDSSRGVFERRAGLVPTSAYP